MPKCEKALNQYYSSYFENAVCSATNHTPFVNETEYNNFSEDDITSMNRDAEKCAKYLNGSQAKWVGKKTSTEDCDIILDGQHIELKYVSAGSGTYFNTSIYYFEKFGFDFRDYMEKYHYYDTLDKLNIKNKHAVKSPVSPAESSKFRHNYEYEYENVIKPAEEVVRKAFLNDIMEYFKANNDDFYTFLSDMVNKNSQTSHKSKPERLVVFNYKKDKIYELNPEDYLTKPNRIYTTDKGIVTDILRFQIGWQNGTGLNNPTIRVFLN